jgi:hypothetical protein
LSWAVSDYLDRDGRFDEGQALRDEVRDRFELPASSSRWYELTDLTIRVLRGDAAAIDPAYDAARGSVDDANPQAQASVASALANLNLLTGRLEAAYEAVMSIEAGHRFAEHLLIAATAAALLGDTDRLQAVAEAVASTPKRGRMVSSIAAAASGALAALRGDTEEAVARLSEALAFGYLRLDRAKLQALFAALVGRDQPEARRASDAAFEVFTEVGATACLDLYAAGLPPAGEQRAAGI